MSAGSKLLTKSVPLYVIATVIILLRCYVRTRIVRSFGRDDWAMLGAGLSATACFDCYMIQITLGLGNNVEIIKANPARYHDLLKARLLHQVWVVVGLAFVKVSLCLFLLRLVARVLYVNVLWGIVAFMIVFTAASVLTLVLQCNPVAAAWDYSLRSPPIGEGNAKCYSRATFKNIGLFNGVIHIITDVLLALLPIPLIWGLQMTTRARISLIAVLSVGIFAAIAGIIRQLNAAPLGEHDLYSIWNFIELHLGIIAATCPALKPLFSRLFDGIQNTANADYAAGNTSDTRICMQPYGNLSAADGRGHRRRGISEESILDSGKRDDEGIRVTRVVYVH